MIRNILIGAALLAVAGLAAGQSVGLHLGSVHLPKRDYNNANPGAYVRFGNGLTLGGYYNSERRPSFYAGYTHSFGPVDVTVGAITGYERAAVMPMVVPSVRLFEIGRVGVRLAFVPKIEKNGAHVLHAMVEWADLK